MECGSNVGRAIMTGTTDQIIQRPFSKSSKPTFVTLWKSTLQYSSTPILVSLWDDTDIRTFITMQVVRVKRAGGVACDGGMGVFMRGNAPDRRTPIEANGIRGDRVGSTRGIWPLPRLHGIHRL